MDHVSTSVAWDVEIRLHVITIRKRLLTVHAMTSAVVLDVWTQTPTTTTLRRLKVVRLAYSKDVLYKRLATLIKMRTAMMEAVNLAHAQDV